MTGPALGPVLILDTSVVLKWFLEKDEADVAQARQLRQAHLSGRCLLRAPDLLLIEIANALTVGHRSSIENVARALEDIRKLRLHLVEFQFSTLAKAVELASTFGVTVYDSYFLALAIESAALLITADIAFIRRVGGHRAVTSLGSLELG
ncbi:MAG: hypothetical protein DMG21_20115 [Acidobacteria bacterium]|nr:MAG: hypothetical protein DMG21_20115 [Acidobacteriota bacterium]